MDEIIKTENLNYVYQRGTPFEFHVLKDINISIKRGEISAIIGPTGSGKSTLIQHFNGLLEPTSGRVLVDGRDIHEKKKREKKSSKGKHLQDEIPLCFEVGLVFQYPEYQLFEETIFDDIAFGPLNMKFSTKEVEERVRTAMEWVELDFESMRNRSPFSLSGGEMRRVALAGVLAMQPKALVLDEPTAGLDPRGKDELYQRIRQFRDNLGMTIVMVTHEMGDAAMLADHLIILNKGEVAADGTCAEIFQKHEQLKEIGLGISPCLELIHRLRAMGINIRNDLMDIKEVAQEILKIYRKKS